MKRTSDRAQQASVGPLLLALVIILVWSACFVAIKASLGAAPPWSFAALRAMVAGITLLPLTAASGKLVPPVAAWPWIAALGLTNTTLGLAAMFLSVGLAGAALPSVLANSQALLVAPLAALLFKEPLSPSRFAALLIGITGVALVMASAAGGRGTASGAALGFVAAAGLAVANLITKYLGTRVDALTATTWQYLLGSAPLVALAVLVERGDPIAWGAEFVAALLFLGVVGSAGASYAWYRLVQRAELIRLNALTLLTPFFSVVLALAIYGEPFGATAAIGAALILAGVTGVAWPDRRRRAQRGDAKGRTGVDGFRNSST